MSNRFKGKVALVTGAGGGIGRAAALGFARDGAKVAIVDLPGAGGDETVGMIVADGGTAISIHADVSNEASVEAMVEATVKAYGRLDVAFNNAGINLDDDSWTAVDAFDRTVAVNLSGVARCIRYEVRQMLKQGTGGAIVNNASMNALVGSPQPGYVGSKHGVIGLTRSAALSFAKQGIRVNAVCPGTVRTAMVTRFDDNPEIAAFINNLAPLGRVAAPVEIANGVLWLCSDEASYVTGHPLVIDGGATAQ